MPPALFFLLRITFAIWGLLCFHMNFRTDFFFLSKTTGTRNQLQTSPSIHHFTGSYSQCGNEKKKMDCKGKNKSQYLQGIWLCLL
jgi:hypothetical protein